MITLYHYFHAIYITYASDSVRSPEPLDRERLCVMQKTSPFFFLFLRQLYCSYPVYELKHLLDISVLKGT